MTFLKVHGWTVDATEQAAQSKNIFSVGELDPRWRNRPTRNRKTLESSWNIATIKQDELTADCLEGLLEGRGDHFPFVVDAWSESGLGPELGSAWTLSDVGGPLATNGFYVTAGVGGLVYNPQFVDDHVAPDGGRWAVTYWYLNGATWERHCTRSDGTGYVNGVSAAAGSGLTISSGGVVLASGESIADLTLWPFYLCDSFAEQDYDWVSGLGIVNRWSFDETYTDDVGRNSLNAIVTAPPVGAVTFGAGVAGRAAVLNGSTTSLQPSSQALTDATEGKGVLSLHVWAKATAMPGVGEKHYLLGALVGASTAKITLTVDELGAVEVLGDADSTDSVTAKSASGTVVVDKWYLYSAVFDLVNNNLSLYVSGVRVAQTVGGWSRTDWFGSTTLNSFFVGKESFIQAATSHWAGSVCELRIFERAHTLAEVLGIYLCERWGRRMPVCRMSSALPRLDAWGDFEGCADPVEVLGASENQSIVSHGGTTDGWVTNAREMSGVLDIVKRSPNVDRIPEPSFGWVMSRDFFPPTATNVGPASGASPLTSVGIGVDLRDKLGPYNAAQSAVEFDGTNHFTTNGLTVAESLAGASCISILAWFSAKGAGGGDEMGIFELAVTNTSTTKLALFINNGDEVELQARSEAGDTVQNLQGGDVSDDEWHLIGGDVDFATGEMRLYIDGVEINSASKTFGQERMDSDFIVPLRIGTRSDGTNPLTGFVASCHGWNRGLSAGEHLKVFELGRKKIFG